MVIINLAKVPNLRKVQFGSLPRRNPRPSSLPRRQIPHLRALTQRTKMGKAMRAVAEDKEAAALMGINVDRVISNTFAISGALAGAAGVMWGLHMGVLYHYVGFVPGMKAFTAAGQLLDWALGKESDENAAEAAKMAPDSVYIAA